MKYVKSLLLLAASVVAILGLSTLVSAKTINTVTPAIDSPTGVTVDSSFSASDKIDSSYVNLLENCDEVSVEEYMETYKSRITQESEALFVREFLFPILGTKK